jgi:hypothetical protein
MPTRRIYTYRDMSALSSGTPKSMYPIGPVDRTPPYASQIRLEYLECYRPTGEGFSNKSVMSQPSTAMLLKNGQATPLPPSHSVCGDGSHDIYSFYGRKSSTFSVSPSHLDVSISRIKITVRLGLFGRLSITKFFDNHVPSTPKHSLETPRPQGMTRQNTEKEAVEGITVSCYM